MIQHKVRIQSIDFATHNVLRIVCDRPKEYRFLPGQATKISLDRDGWRDAAHPFTFTSLPQDKHLEFHIKTYPERRGFTNELLSVQIEDSLFLHDVFGSLLYRAEGTFISGGAGFTPFLAILRDLNSQHRLYSNRLICANNKREDIICEAEMREMLGGRCINILSAENAEGYHHGQIDADFLTTQVSDFERPVYLCGPPPMVESLSALLLHLGLENRLLTVENGA